MIWLGPEAAALCCRVGDFSWWHPATLSYETMPGPFVLAFPCGLANHASQVERRRDTNGQWRVSSVFSLSESKVQTVHPRKSEGWGWLFSHTKSAISGWSPCFYARKVLPRPRQSVLCHRAAADCARIFWQRQQTRAKCSLMVLAENLKNTKKQALAETNTRTMCESMLGPSMMLAVDKPAWTQEG